MTVAYGDRVVLSRVDVILPAGSLIALVGPSGAGKSTLFRCLAGLVRPRAGVVEVLGRPPADVRRQVGYAPQHHAVDWRFPLSVADAALTGRFGVLGLFRRPSAVDRQLVRARLEDVGLAGCADAPITALNTHERSRLLLARALVKDPGLLMLDETSLGTDPAGDSDLRAVLERFARQGRTVAVATTDLRAVRGWFDEVVLLNGRVVAQGQPGDVLTRANLAATYGSTTLTARVDAAYFAVDDGPPGR